MMSMFGNAMRNVMAARERQAQRYVAKFLSEMDDATLKSIGHSRQGLKKNGF